MQQLLHFSWRHLLCHLLYQFFSHNSYMLGLLEDVHKTWGTSRMGNNLINMVMMMMTMIKMLQTGGVELPNISLDVSFVPCL